jgi:hypothetical protein
MAGKKRRGSDTSVSTVEIPNTPPGVEPPQPSRWQLMTSGILVGLWIIFLAWMAFTG